MQTVRKEDEKQDKAHIMYDLRKKGWNTDPMTTSEFGLIHASRAKNLRCTIKGIYPKNEELGIKIIRRQTIEIGGERVSGEFNDYTIFIPTKSRSGDIVETFRGFNRNLENGFENEEKSVHFLICINRLRLITDQLCMWDSPNVIYSTFI